jgi:hypothetical protein
LRCSDVRGKVELATKHGYSSCTWSSSNSVGRSREGVNKAQRPSVSRALVIVCRGRGVGLRGASLCLPWTSLEADKISFSSARLPISTWLPLYQIPKSNLLVNPSLCRLRWRGGWRRRPPWDRERDGSPWPSCCWPLPSSRRRLQPPPPARPSMLFSSTASASQVFLPFFISKRLSSKADAFGSFTC